MTIDRGSHNQWREFGFRINRKRYHQYEYFIEFNFWKWFLTFSWKSGIKQKMRMARFQRLVRLPHRRNTEVYYEHNRKS